MKISKLFHWLYAFLLFLPIIFVLPTLLYYGFNDNSTAQEYIKEEPIYYETNEVVSYEDLEYEHAYLWLGGFSGSSTSSYFVCQIYVDDSIKDLFTSWNDNTTNVRMWYNGTGSVQLNAYQETTYLNAVNINNLAFPFVVNANYLTTNHSVLDYITSYSSYVKEYQEVTYTMGITESVNQAIIDTFDLPMFAWATNNILVAPFSSICSFFGIASTSVLIKYLYYWLTISVIWLVFDLLMYIPLLVHNYIDKARIE